MLQQAVVLSIVSRHIAAALQEVPLHLDLREAPEEHLYFLPPLLKALPFEELLLAPRHASSAEALLRSDDMAAASAISLRRLAASVACTDTLQRYPRLEELQLYAGVLGRLYPGGCLGPVPMAALGRQ